MIRDRGARRWWRAGGLRARVIVVGLLAVAPAVLLLLQSGLERRHHAAEDAKQHVQRLVREAVVQEQSLLNDAVDLLALLGELPELRRPDGPACPAFFGDLLRRYPRYTNIVVARPSGIVACSAFAAAGPTTLADRPWFQRVSETRRTTISNYVVGRLSGKPVLTVAHPVLDRRGLLTAVVSVGIDLRWFEKMFDDAELPAGRRLVIADSEGVIIKRLPDVERFTGQSARDTPLVAAMLSQQEGVAELIGLDGVPHLFAFARLGAAAEPGGLHIAVGIPAVEALAEADRLVRRGLATLLAAAALALAVAWWGSELVLRSVGALVDAARRLAAGEMHARTGLAHSRSELGELARAFDEMAQKVERRTLELTAANAELEAFSYSVSHDLRAPLRAIDGFSRILIDEHSAALSDSARRQLGLVRQNAQQMGQLIDDLLALSRLGRQAVRMERVDTGELVQAVREELAAEFQGRAIEFVMQPLPPCAGDPVLLKQVFVNLLSNALKFTRRRERARIEIGSRVIDGATVFFVADDGVGFDMKYADKLFGLFQRFHRAEDYEGTGVGLAIVRRIVERHGGRVWAEAAVGRGATIFFTLGGSS